MSVVQPVPEAAAEDRVAQTYGRLREMFGTETVPEPFLYCGAVPAFLQDFYMNFKKFVHGAGKLDTRTRSLIALAVSAHGGSRVWQEYWETELTERQGVNPQTVADVFAVVAANSMYNTFFKFRSLAGSSVFEGMSVGLRAHTFANTTLDEATVELLNIAISVINGCAPCTSGHVKKAGQLNISDEQIQEAVQCAATMLSGVRFLASVCG